ncbi:MAG: hypothetical protein CMB78_05675 [Euryarchaeota archaeon]|nr:hypothetical protein [Euryarchaeota archaeon]|tara:strand:- start:760 stop:1326 length:567 start_codon:yes stop_codon:yes gene_type:complete
MNLSKFRVSFAMLVVTIILNRVGVNLIMSQPDNDDFWLLGSCLSICSVLAFLATAVSFSYSLGLKEVPTEMVNVYRDPSDNTWKSIKEEVVNFEGDDARVIGFTFLGLSILSIAMMVLLGMVFLIIVIFNNPLYGPTTCGSICQGSYDGAVLSIKASVAFFVFGLIALARPWSWIPLSWRQKSDGSDE